METTNARRFDDYELTSADKEAWWEYIRYHLPREYSCLAERYYSNKRDPNLEPDYTPKDMDINDYFDLYNLPKVTALRGIIKVNDKQVSTYLNHEKWYSKRLFFAKLKRTPIFKEWRQRQIKCQYGKCVWCRRPIYLYSPDTHTDHILPLLWYGTNSFDNFALACADCNTEKKASTIGYHGAKGKPGENSMPSWVKPNPTTQYACSHPEVVNSQVGKVSDEEVEQEYRDYKRQYYTKQYRRQLAHNYSEDSSITNYPAF